MITYIHMTGGRKKVLRPVSKLDARMEGRRIALIFDDMVITEGRYAGTDRMSMAGADHGEFVHIENTIEGSELLDSVISTRYICGWMPLEDGETAEDIICKELTDKKNRRQKND